MKWIHWLSSFVLPIFYLEFNFPITVICKEFSLNATDIGIKDEFTPNISNSKDALNLIQDAIGQANFTGKVGIGMEAHASEFYKDGLYDFNFEDPISDKSQSQTDNLTNMYTKYVSEFPLVSIKDPYDETDWSAWSNITANTNIQIVGDNLNISNPERIASAVKNKSSNCLMLKVTQMRTLTESIKANLLAKSSGWSTMVTFEFICCRSLHKYRHI